jgi:hypothetical protein
LIKTDSVGNKLWHKTYKKDDTYHIASGGEQTNDLGYIITGVYSDAFVKQNLFIVKTDSSGNVEWTKTYEEDVNTGHNRICKTSNGNYISSAWTKFNGIGGTILRKLNGDGDTIWEKQVERGYNLGFFSKPIILGNEDIVFAGFIEDSPDNYSGWLVKTDSLGNIIWERQYTIGNSTYSLFNDLKTTEDGGFIMCGYAMNPSQDAWVVKVDSNGCLVPGCNNDVVEILLSEGEYLQQNYPNPANCNTSIPVSVPQGKNATLFVSNLTGQYMEIISVLSNTNEIELDVSDYPAGMYLYSIEIDGKVMETRRMIVE